MYVIGYNLDTVFQYTLGVPSPLLDKVSTSDAGFLNTINGGDPHPFNSGDKVSYTVQDINALTAGTYYWRARGMDPTPGSNAYGAWATMRSFTISGAAPAPTVTSVTGENPQTTAGGKSITINGTDFVATPTVTVGGTLATEVTWVSATQLTATAPAKVAGSYDVVVTNPDTQFGTCASCMTYIAPPTVTSVSPNNNLNPAGGEIITIDGSGIKVGANGVKVDTTFSTTSGTSSSATFTTPAHSAGSVTLRVYGADGTDTNGIYYDYSPFTYGLPITGVLTSIVFNTGVAAPAYNSILWKGSLNSGKVKFQIAASDFSTGPWNDSDFIGSDGTTCGSAFWYEPGGPDTPMELGCFAELNNKRFFKYKVQLCSSSLCDVSGAQTPIVTDIIINWSP